MNKKYVEEEFIKEERKKLNQRKPFAYSSLPNFFDPKLLQEVKKELQEIVFFFFFFLFLTFPFPPFPPLLFISYSNFFFFFFFRLFM